jgi:hypothetical protein
MNTIDTKIDAHIDQNVDYWIQQLARLCAQPSVSAQNFGIVECAELVATMLREQGYAPKSCRLTGIRWCMARLQGRTAVPTKPSSSTSTTMCSPPNRWTVGIPAV